jgi:hypothetical protein
MVFLALGVEIAYLSHSPAESPNGRSPADTRSDGFSCMTPLLLIPTDMQKEIELGNSTQSPV